MSDGSVLHEDNKSTCLPADVTDDSCIFKYFEIGRPSHVSPFLLNYVTIPSFKSLNLFIAVL